MVKDIDLQLPFYAKASISLIGLIAFFAIIYIAQGIIIPIVFAIIFAIVLHPVVNALVRLKVNRILAIVITMLFTSFTLLLLLALLFAQASRFTESWPMLVDKFTELLNQIITDASGYFDIDQIKIHEWITKSTHELLSFSNESIGKTLLTVGNGVMTMLLIPVYIFILLFYHPLLLEFIHRLFSKSNQTQVTEVVTQTKSVIQHYLVGLAIEAIIVAGLDISVLLLLGIDYAILLGIIGALLNVIPYIGGLVAVALPMMVALATKSSGWYAIYILIGYYIIQLIDNNYIVPIIVSSKVKINALFSIIVVLIGNAMWGISGMFLSIPLLAILKVICDHIELLKPWGFLVGDSMPTKTGYQPFHQRLIKKTLL